MTVAESVPKEAAKPAKAAEPSGKKKVKEFDGPLSRPVVKTSINVRSLQAQRVMKRSFERLARALFSIEVILHIIGDENEVNEVEELICNLLNQAETEMSDTSARLSAVISANQIESEIEYSQPQKISFEITCPQVARFARLVSQLDDLMDQVDTLWLGAVLSSRDRSRTTFEWQQRLIKLAARIITIENRARIAAYNKGKGEEVEQAAPETAIEDEELAAETQIAEEEAAKADKAPAASKRAKPKAAAAKPKAAEATTLEADPA